MFQFDIFWNQLSWDIIHFSYSVNRLCYSLESPESLLLIYSLASSVQHSTSAVSEKLLSYSAEQHLVHTVSHFFVMGSLWNPQQNSVFGTSNVFPFCSSAEQIESDSCVGVELALFFFCHPLLGWSAAGAAVRWVRGHTVVLFWEKGLLCCQVAVVGRDSYGFVFPPRVTASAASLTDDPPPDPPNLNPMALTLALTPASPRAGSEYEHMCVRPSSGCVRRPRPITLASTDVTGLEECEECGGAGAGVSILGPGQRGAGLLSIGRQFSSALLADCRADWLEMVSAASLLEMACSTFMVIALTRAFWRPSAKQCVRKQDLFLLSLCVWLL